MSLMPSNLSNFVGLKQVLIKFVNSIWIKKQLFIPTPNKGQPRQIINKITIQT